MTAHCPLVLKSTSKSDVSALLAYALHSESPGQEKTMLLQAM